MRDGCSARARVVYEAGGDRAETDSGDVRLLNMIARYTRPEMGRIFSDENRFAQWLEVELAASEALAETGAVPAVAAQALRAHAGFDVARIHEVERQVKHDVIAFTTAVSEIMAPTRHPDSLRWVHVG